MMKYLLAALLLLSSPAFAQDYGITETPFNRFVKQPAVVWAAYSNHTLLTTTPDLRDLLIRKMRADKIKTARSLLPGSREEIKIAYLNAKTAMYGGADDEVFVEVPVYDSSGNQLRSISVPHSYEFPKGLLNIAQILYIKNGRLLSTVSHVAPLIDITTPAGMVLGRAEYFATAFNSNPQFISSPKDKIIYLTQTRTLIDADSAKQEDRLKETFGRNLTQSLWPSLLSGKSRMYVYSSNKKINPKELAGGEWTGESVSVPVYDSVGNIGASKIIYPEVSAQYFKKIEIMQTWFYNETKNVVFNKIPEIILFANVAGSSGIAELKPAIKIVF